ncbi:MAG: hypothetical protein AAFR75_02915 [Pseudomonadota bacterium]
MTIINRLVTEPAKGAIRRVREFDAYIAINQPHVYRRGLHWLGFMIAGVVALGGVLQFRMLFSREAEVTIDMITDPAMSIHELLGLIAITVPTLVLAIWISRGFLRRTAPEVRGRSLFPLLVLGAAAVDVATASLPSVGFHFLFLVLSVQMVALWFVSLIAVVPWHSLNPSYDERRSVFQDVITWVVFQFISFWAIGGSVLSMRDGNPIPIIALCVVLYALGWIGRKELDEHLSVRAPAGNPPTEGMFQASVMILGTQPILVSLAAWTGLCLLLLAVGLESLEVFALPAILGVTILFYDRHNRSKFIDIAAMPHRVLAHDNE